MHKRYISSTNKVIFKARMYQLSLELRSKDDFKADEIEAFFSDFVTIRDSHAFSSQDPKIVSVFFEVQAFEVIMISDIMDRAKEIFSNYFVAELRVLDDDLEDLDIELDMTVRTETIKA